MKKALWQSLTIAFLTLLTLPSPSWALGYTETKYPIVLVHGLLGFDNIGPAGYFHAIPSALSADGATVYVSSVSAVNSTTLRGEQLLAYVKQVLAASGASKVNLIAHSHGGPTARYVASVRPDLVASVTSVGGTNKGTPVADILIGVTPPGSLSQSAINSVLNGMGSLISFLSGNPSLPQSTNAAFISNSTAGAAAFNA